MCGVIGFKFLKAPNLDGLEFIKQLFLESEIRGRHASGVALVAEDASGVVVHKAPIPASEFVDTEWEKHVESWAPTAGILHTRYSTSGDSQDNENNQPLASRRIAVAHNGIVSMSLPEEYGEQFGVKTKTANDTEVILRKVAPYGNAGATWYQAIANGLSDIHDVGDHPPVFACVFVDSTGQIHGVRDHIRPLWRFKVPSLDLIGFASTRDIITRAAYTCELDDPGDVEIMQCEPYVVYTDDFEATALDFDYPTEFRFKRPRLVNRHNLRKLNSSYPTAPDPFDGALSFQDETEAFITYYKAIVPTWEVDPNYPLLTYLFERYELSKEQEYWACWLYSVFYQPGTLFWFIQEFPDFDKVDEGRLQRWHDKNWRKLRYNTDRKYEKGHLVEMFRSYKAMIGKGTQEEFFSALLKSKDKVENFHTVWKQLIKLERFGRYATYIYTEALARCMGMPIEADTIFLKEAASSRSGLCYATLLPSLAEKGYKFTRENYEALNNRYHRLKLKVQQAHPDVVVDDWFMESALCAFKGFFRPTKGRYIGYYIDRMQEEIRQLESEKEATSGVDWKVLWQFREESFLHDFLGEQQEKGWTGIRKHLEFVYRDQGLMVNTRPLTRRGLL